MSSSFESVRSILHATPPLSEVLQEAERFWAHIHPDKEPEPYEEHYNRVNAYFATIVEKNGLDAVIDRLVTDSVRLLFAHSGQEEAGPWLKHLFVQTVVYHDFGKVNENFQAHPKKMNNRAFLPMRRDNPLAHRHSKLGAYCYIVRHFEALRQSALFDRQDLPKAYAVVLFFSYSILMHHAASLNRPDRKGVRFEPEELAWMKQYLSLYHIEADERITGRLLEETFLDQKFFQSVFDSADASGGFPLFALLRLNFSLLTAADYLATGQYNYNLHLKSDEDWGIFSGDRRTKIIDALCLNEQKPHNRQAYALFAKKQQGAYHLQHPTSPLDTNLNVLRTEMAVEVLETLRQHADKRLFYLEAPTGGGKTNLSMLTVAELLRNNPELTKVVYVFPFTTLITQTHKAILETLLLPEEDLGLLHSRAGFQAKTAFNKDSEEEEDGLYGTYRRDFLQNLFALYPVTLMTHIRFFDVLKSNYKEDIYLLHRLANSIVVLDELQSYPPVHWDKMLHLLDRYGDYFNIRFLMMSATLPRIDGIAAVRRASGGRLPAVQDLLPDPKRYFVNENFKNRVQFNFELLEHYTEITAEELAREVKDRSAQYAQKGSGRVFTIVEFIFKKSAAEFYQIIQAPSETPFFDEVLVLSGTILESQRRKIINYLKRQRDAKDLKILLITTQVVEAGVDIDMDLGFKNVSLIDSDEQLAGRVNRNVGKRLCEVCLFRKDNPQTLYKSDLRYKITRNLPVSFHRDILESKRFEQLYDKVFEEIEKENKSALKANFEQEYQGFIRQLDFKKVSEQFKLIEQHTLSVYVPLDLPIAIEGENGLPEPFFNTFELEFLQKASSYGVFDTDRTHVHGAAVWRFYRDILARPNTDFIAKKIERRAIQGILTKFTFSLFASPDNRKKLEANSSPEWSLDNYYYLERWQEDDLYHLESGLNETRLSDPIV